MKEKVFLGFFCLLLCSQAFGQSYSGGSGEETDPYLISSKADMEILAMLVNDGIHYSGEYFLLTQDITEEVTTVIGIGYTVGIGENKFRGNFDGGGHIVKVNINISDIAGVFGSIDGATIKKLGVEGSITSSTSFEVGGICGGANNSAITNCYNAATISRAVTNNRACVGGICGNPSNTTITNCYNMGNIAASTIDDYYIIAGGICGFGSISSNMITNCFAANTAITAQTAFAYGSRISEVTVQNSYALATMQINGEAKNSEDANSSEGKDATLSNFQSQSWIETNLGWDFDNVWEMSDISSANQGLPVFKKSSAPTSIEEILYKISLSSVIGYYSITGTKLPKAPEKGMYIILYDNGMSEKRMK